MSSGCYISILWGESVESVRQRKNMALNLMQNTSKTVDFFIISLLFSVSEKDLSVRNKWKTKQTHRHWPGVLRCESELSLNFELQ